MRIETLYIDGFGHFTQRTFGPFNAPITIFDGENEAGKSTLLAFIRTVLYGFPTRGRNEYYPPFRGGRHGGHMVVSDDSGTRYIVERYAAARGGNLSIKDLDGTSYPDAKLRELLGHSSKEVFEKVFAFGLDELQEMNSLDDEEVQGRIYSAGLGVTDLPRVEKTIEDYQGKIYRPGGNLGMAQSIAQVLAELEEVEKELSSHHQDAPRYAELTERTEKIATELAGLEEDRAEIKGALDRQGKLLAVRDDVVETGILEAKMSEVVSPPQFPQDGIARLENILEQIAKLEEVVHQAAETVENLQEVVARPLPGAILLEDAEDIRKARSERARLEAAVRDLPERKAEADQQKAEVNRLLTELGPGWDAIRLQGIEVSIPVRDRVNQGKEQVARLRDALANRQTEKESAEKESRSSDEVLKQAADELDQAALPPLDEAELARRRSAINAARNGSERLNGLLLRQAELRATGGQVAGRLPILVAALGFLVIGILLGAWSLVGNGGIPEVVFAAFSIAVGIGLAAWGYRAGKQDGISDQIGEIESQIANVESELSLNKDILGLASVDFAGLEVAGEELQESVRRWTERETMERTHREAEQDSERRRQDLERATEALARSENDRAELEDRWVEWLRERDLPETMSADGVLELFSKVEAARFSLLNQQQRQDRVSAIGHDVQEICDLVVPLARIHGVSVDGDNPATLVPAIDELALRLESAQGEVKTQEANRASLVEYEGRLDQEKHRLKSARDDLKDLLALAAIEDVEGVEEFRRIASIYDEYKEWQHQLEGHKTTIQRVFGLGIDHKSLRSEIGERSSVAIEESVHDAQQSLDEVESKRDNLRENSILTYKELAELGSSDEASDLMSKRETFLEEIRDLGTQWSRYSLALFMLRMARNHHERERQPQVVQTASEFFREITGDRYTGLRAPAGEPVIIAVTASGEEMRASQLSRGTREQMYLSLRFGLVRELSQHMASLPVIIDDALVNSDPSRARVAAECLGKLVDTNQVLVFTCHPTLVQQFKEACPDAEIQKLEQVQGS